MSRAKKITRREGEGSRLLGGAERSNRREEGNKTITIEKK